MSIRNVKNKNIQITQITKDDIIVENINDDLLNNIMNHNNPVESQKILSFCVEKVNEKLLYYENLKNKIIKIAETIDAKQLEKNDNVYLEINLNEPQFVDNILYENIIVDNRKQIKIKLNDIDLQKIKIIDNTRREIQLTALCHKTIKVTYTIGFDLNDINLITNVIKCTCRV